MASAEGLRQARHHFTQAAAHRVMGELALLDQLAVAGYFSHPGRNILWDSANGFVFDTSFDTSGAGPHEVDPESFVKLREVGAIVAAACPTHSVVPSDYG